MSLGKKLVALTSMLFLEQFKNTTLVLSPFSVKSKSKHFSGSVFEKKAELIL
jgi:hypothetical protein